MIYLSLLLYVAALYIRPGEAVPSWGLIPFVELLSIVVVVLAALAYVKEPRRWDGLPHDWFVVGFWLAIVASNLAWGWLGGALKGFVEFFRIVFYYFLMRFAVREPWHLRGLMGLLVGLALLQAAGGIALYYTGHGVGDLELMGDRRIRGTGIFNDPNDLAQALLMVVPFLLVAIAARGMPSGRRVLGLLALVPILLALVLTGSRGGALAFGVIAVACAAWRFGRVAGALAVVGALAAVIVAGPGRVMEISPSEGGAELFAQAVTETTSGAPPSRREASYRERIEAWAEGLTMLRERPLFGVGYSRFLDFHERVAHNSFIHTFAELGLVGAFFGMGLVYWFWKGLHPFADRGPRATALTMSGMAVLVTASFLSRQYDVVLYTLLGLGACHAAMTPSPDRRLTMTRRDLRNILLLTVAGVVAAKLAVTVLNAWGRG